MKKQSKLIIVFAIVVIAIVSYYIADTIIVIQSSLPCYYASFSNVDDRIEATQLIIEATLVGEPENILDYKDEFRSGYTLSNVKINRMLKDTSGKLEIGDVIQIQEPYYIVDRRFKPGKLEIGYGDYTKIEKSKSYILFLNWHKGLNIYGISSLHEGKYNLDSLDKLELEKSSRNENYGNLKREVLKLYSK
jgi:hypothetical protein